VAIPSAEGDGLCPARDCRHGFNSISNQGVVLAKGWIGAADRGCRLRAAGAAVSIFTPLW
jgi:hypothetical protein